MITAHNVDTEDPGAPPFEAIWALDAGTRHAGVALVAYGTGLALDAYSLSTSRASVADMLDEIERATAGWPTGGVVLVSEWPRRYQSARSTWQDIDGLREVVELVEGFDFFAATRRVSPGVWKGNVPKHIHHARVGAALKAGEALRLAWDDLGPDGRDAVALGKWVSANRGRLRLP